MSSARIVLRSRLAAAVTAVAACTGLVLAFGPAAGAAPAAAPGAVGGATAATVGPLRPGVRAACDSTLARGHVRCFALVRTDVSSRQSLAPRTAPAGYGPADLHAAYDLPATGAGAPTVAIVDAYDDPTAAADLATYRAQYGLPACTTANGCFTKVNEDGNTSPLPAADAGWSTEIALDLDMVSATCPNCHLLLVEANSNSLADLGTAENTAVRLGAKYVSNSFGGPEASLYSPQADAYFNHPGVAITVSNGDSGYGAEFPASSRYVTAVGGTSLTKTTTGRGWAETVWNDLATGHGATGSGCSAYDAKQAWQTDTGCTKRTIGDVSAVADPETGVAVYSNSDGGWIIVGGTSASAPLIAGVYALAGPPAAGTYPASYPYARPGTLNDVTSGTDGSCAPNPAYWCTAQVGYDAPTGLGTPAGVAAFVAPDGYTPIAPKRAFDTRTGTGGVPVQKLAAGATLQVPFAGRADLGIPADATAVALNLTAVGATQSTYLTAWPTGSPRPHTSTLNVADSHPAANFDMVALGTGGDLDFYNGAGSVNLLADVAGYYTTVGGQQYTPVSPVRAFDTRTGTGGAPKAPVGPNSTITIQLTGVDGVPADATAVALNLTAVDATQSTYLTAWPAGTTRPTASTLNVSDPHARPNFTVVSVGAGGKVSFYNNAGSVNLLADIAGYYTATGGELYLPMTPVRAFDTRTGTGGAPKAPVGPNSTITIQLTGVDGVPADATAVALNLTAVDATQSTYLTAWPAGTTRPTASTLNVSDPHARPNFTVVSVGAGGKVSFYNNAGSVNLLADIAGYVVPVGG